MQIGKAIMSAYLLALLLGLGSLIPGWIAIAQTNIAWPKAFEVASIRPAAPGGGPLDIEANPGGRWRATNVSVRWLILYAYGIRPEQIEALPAWARSRKYTIVAEARPDMLKNFRMLGELPPDQRKQVVQGYMRSWHTMARALLADRFKLKEHVRTKELPVYELVVARGGPKLKPPNAADFPGLAGRIYSLGSFWFSKDAGDGTRMMNAFGIPISVMVAELNDETGRVVIDKTGLTGRYDFTLKWDIRADRLDVMEMPRQSKLAPQPSFTGPSIFTALEEQLGLKLKPAKGPVQVLVVDHIEPPTPN